MQDIKHKILDQDTSLQWIMKRGIKTIMEIPTIDQIYDNISFKLGAFYKRFWQNRQDGLKQNTRKAGEIIALAENMKQTTRQDDRLIKVCAYARQIKKFQSDHYEEWKEYIWADLQSEQRKEMEDYVELLTPPVPLDKEPKDAYESRQREKMYCAYKNMKKGMLLVEIFQKIWTIRMYRKNNKPLDQQRHINLTRDILEQISKINPSIRGFLSNNMGQEEWKQIYKLW